VWESQSSNMESTSLGRRQFSRARFKNGPTHHGTDFDMCFFYKFGGDHSRSIHLDNDHFLSSVHT
jgi:hypothetical protein